MKINITYLELVAIQGEFQQFQSMFPNMSNYILQNRFRDFFNKNSIHITQMNEKRKKLFEDNIEFDENGMPKQEIIEKKIIDVQGAAKEQPKYDFKYKSEEHKKAFTEGNEKLQQHPCTIEI